MEVMELIEYLQELVDTAPKVPISGKVILDKKELLGILDDVVSFLPDELKKAQWILGERERILQEAKTQYEAMKKESEIIMKKQVENHDVTKAAKIKAQEIIGQAQRDAKLMRLSAREYADEILSQLDKEIEDKGRELINKMKRDMDECLTTISKGMGNSTNEIRSNIKELRAMK